VTGGGLPRWQQIWRRLAGARIVVAMVAAVGIASAAVVADLVANVVSSQLASRLQGTALPVALLCLVTLVVVVVREYRGTLPGPVRPVEEEIVDSSARRPLPPPVKTVGRDDVISATAEAAAKHGLVFVLGPRGIGTSTVAVEAAWRLAPDSTRQLYIDLRGQSADEPESARHIIVRVLTVLGIPSARAAAPDPAALVVEELKDTDRVLVLDNVARADQVAWLARAIPGARLIAAGDVPPQQVPAAFATMLATVTVGPLDRDSALRLLKQQDAGPPGMRLSDRITASPEAAAELADRFRRLPRTLIRLGRWLAANPQVTIKQLLGRGETWLEGSPPGDGLEGAAQDVRTLLARLRQLPIVELPESAAAVLADETPDRTRALLADLVDRGLVERVPPDRYRVLPSGAASALAAGSSGRRRGDQHVVRLLSFYADRAARHAAALSPNQPLADREEARRWFRTEDRALLRWQQLRQPPSVAQQLWRIGDALDAWFGWENLLNDRRDAATAMAEAAEQLGDGQARQRALLRMSAVCRTLGDLEHAYRSISRAESLHRADRGHGSSPTRTARGVYELEAGDVDAARRAFERSKAVRPKRDFAGRVIDLTNTAAALLAEGRRDPAHHLLSEALDLAENTGDVAGEGGALELLGVVAARRRKVDHAMATWVRAQFLYEQLNDELGQARCLLHRAALRRSLPSSGEKDLRETENLLKQSIERRGEQRFGQGIALANLHLGEIARDLGQPADVVEGYRQAGLRALTPWAESRAEPATVAATRARLAALDK
jgi:tetratricopeptide (TPR) repeat protein